MPESILPRGARIPLALLALSLLALAAAADDYMAALGEYRPDFFAELQDVELANGRAYLFGVGGLAIVDIADPAHPDLLGRYQPPGHPYNRFYRGAVGATHAYGGGREDLLSVIDIGVESAPSLVSVHGEAGMSYEGAALAGDLLYAARHADGLEVIDVADPATPASLHVVSDLSNTWDLVLNGGHAYVADGAGGLAVLDLADPAAPQRVASLPTLGAAVDVDLAGDLVFVACGSAGVEIFDVSDPAGVIWVGNYDSSALAISLAATDGRLYLADWDDVEVVDVSTPASPSRMGWENTPVRAMGLAASGGVVHVADWSRFRTYAFGPTLDGDIEVWPLALDFGVVPVGETADTTFTVANTSGGGLIVSDILSFNPNFVVPPPTSFSLAPGEERAVAVEFTPAAPGYDGTFLRVDSGDPDEPEVRLTVSADDDPSYLDLGEMAPDFELIDMDGVTHRLSDYLGQVVVLAFFANW